MLYVMFLHFALRSELWVILDGQESLERTAINDLNQACCFPTGEKNKTMACKISHDFSYEVGDNDRFWADSFTASSLAPLEPQTEAQTRQEYGFSALVRPVAVI